MAAESTLERPGLKAVPAARSAAGREPPLRIGLSARLLHADSAGTLGFRNKTLQFLESSLAHWIMAHGALVFMIPTLETDASLRRASVSMRDYVDALDGLVLQGGADLSPTTYGEEPRRPDWRGDRLRDLYEIDLLWEFVIHRKPVLGICRGAQLVNVAFNGTLHQDIATEVPNAARHVDREAYDTLYHDVSFEPGSRLAELYGAGHRARVTSIHHQSVKRLGNSLVVEARSPSDGVVEAIRWTGGSFVMGLQWHPEFHPPAGADLLDSGPIMAEFLGEARRRKQDGGQRAAAGASTAKQP
ncbi:MAG TPA: type 1 glutamine amidotransferase [Burkholderiales bacterium]|nr:type 1 glutamine amidotransferase [Burkholderiales bacterium]